jgi:hypothetical protein
LASDVVSAAHQFAKTGRHAAPASVGGHERVHDLDTDEDWLLAPGKRSRVAPWSVSAWGGIFDAVAQAFVVIAARIMPGIRGHHEDGSVMFHVRPGYSRVGVFTYSRTATAHIFRLTGFAGQSVCAAVTFGGYSFSAPYGAADRRSSETD